MSAPGIVGRTRRDGEDLRRGDRLARVRDRCEGQAARHRPLPRRRASRSDHARVAELSQAALRPGRPETNVTTKPPSNAKLSLPQWIPAFAGMTYGRVPYG